jgi:DUF4097 and DUF4098 domain-containing protein YvlB
MATVERTFETPGPVVLRLSIPEGDIEVVAGEDGAVLVEATSVRGGQDAVDALRIELAERAGRYEVTVEAPTGRFGARRKHAVSVRVSCPEGAALECATASADIHGRGPLGDVQVHTASGDVSFEDVASLAMEAASADVVVREAVGDVAVKTTSGDVELRAVGGELVVAVVSGDVSVGAVGGDCRINTVSGDVELRELRGSALVNAVSGDVELGIPPGLRLWLDLRSASGDVRSDLDPSDAASGGDAAAAELTVRTVSGDIRIRRARA